MSVVEKIPTKPIEGQKMGTSGLRKKVSVFASEHYLSNFVESVFRVLRRTYGDELDGSTIVVGGDGRYFNKDGLRLIIRAAFAHGVGSIIVGEDGLLSTPCTSHFIMSKKLFGGFIMTASHNPGGPKADWGVKYNDKTGASANEAMTAAMYEESRVVDSLLLLRDDALPPLTLTAGTSISVSMPGTAQPTRTIHVESSTAEYVSLMKSLFDFPLIHRLLHHPKFSMLLDGMSGVAGPYLHAIFERELGCPAEWLLRAAPSPDFGSTPSHIAHPDPNLSYAAELVARMQQPNAPLFGAAFDGDADRNMVLGGCPYTFVTPSDSLAILVDHAEEAIPYFQKAKGGEGVLGVARSMPTSQAADIVAAAKGIPCYSVPTGWKFFCNLMDAKRANILGEESFGTGAAYVREKDGIFAALCWLSLLAYVNKSSLDAASPSADLIGVLDVQKDFWAQYGRCLYVRYDFEGVDGPGANTMMEALGGQAAAGVLTGKCLSADGHSFTIEGAEVFCYTDPVDGSVSPNQGIIITMAGKTRAVLRLSGTGSVGATVRMYLEVVQPAEAGKDKDFAAMDALAAVKPLAAAVLDLCELKKHVGTDIPTVIT